MKAKILRPPIHAGKPMAWSKGAVVNGLVFLAGTTGRSPVDDKPLPTAREQAILCLDRIKERLEEVGSGIENIFFLRYYIKRRPDWPEVSKAKNAWFKKYGMDIEKRPLPSTLIKDVGLDLDDMLVEIEALATVPERPAKRRRSSRAARSR